MAGEPFDPRKRRITTDRETIRGWAEEVDAVPVRRIQSGGPRIRIVREPDVGDTHERIGWSEFFAAMGERDLVLIYREATHPTPFEVVPRHEAVVGSPGEREEMETALLDGETVTSTTTDRVGTGAEFAGDEGFASIDRGTDAAGSSMEAASDDGGKSTARPSTAPGAEPVSTDTATEADEASPISLSRDELGKTVVNDRGQEVGLVTAVDEDMDLLYVDAEPGITEHIKAALDWGDADEDDFPVRAERILEIGDDRVVLKPDGDLPGTDDGT